MTEFGTVLDVKGEFATVRIGRNSACASCGKCGMTEGQKHVDFFAANDVGAAVGDTVEVALPETSATKLALVGYILPLVPALSLLFVSLALGWAEWLALLLFAVGLAVGFVAVALLDSAKKHKWTKQVHIVSVVGSAAHAETDNDGQNTSTRQSTEKKNQ